MPPKKLPKFAIRKKKRTHDENLKSLCCVCTRKNLNDLQNVSSVMAGLVKKFAQPAYDRDGGQHPTVICSTCRKTCYAYQKAEEEGAQPSRKFPKKFDYNTLVHPSVVTRNSPDCRCSFCVIARLQFTDHVEHNKEYSNTVGSDATADLNTSAQICSNCQSELRQGVRHECTSQMRRKNIASHLATLSDTTLQHVTRAGLKEVAQRQVVNTNIPGSSATLKSGAGGKNPMTVNFGPAKERRSMTTEDWLRIKKTLNLSNLQTKKIAKEVRTGTQDRGVIEPGLSKALVDGNHTLEDIFIKETVLVMNKDGVEEEKQLIFCTDVEVLVQRLVESRDINEETMTVKVGLDGGQA